MIVGYSLTRTRTVSLTIFTRVMIGRYSISTWFNYTRVMIGTYSFFSVEITVCFNIPF